MPLHEIVPSFLPPFTQISQEARLKETQCHVTSEDLRIDRLDLGCFALHTNEQQASEDERGDAHDNGARLRDS